MSRPVAGRARVARDRELLATRDHHEPHRVLGAHPAGEGRVLVRVWRPEATAVRVLPESGRPLTLRHRGDGLFEGVCRARSGLGRYRVEVTYPDGVVDTFHDPYAFPPTLGELDLHLVREGRHEELANHLGAQPRVVDGVGGVAFAVWAPSARSVSLVGDFNGWDGRLHPMRTMGASGVWELFMPGVAEGAHYKFEIRGADGSLVLHADPYAQATEVPPATASVVVRPHHEWADATWMADRQERRLWAEPVSIYEVHLGSWRRVPEEGERSLTYAELADRLTAEVGELGFTHVELLPVMEHPFAPSWGYQATGYFAPTARYGTPDDFRGLVDRLHAAGIGVILDWVPAHFPRDEWALARFDGTALYEHEDPRRGAHPDWGTLIFNYARPEVANFLLASALFWLDSYHADGLRVDAVASMLYRDYSRAPGEWVPNEFGGREDLEAIAFLRELNAVTHRRQGGIAMCAEESTAWPGVSRPVEAGGLGFGFKWNIGWMHDTLDYFARDPVHRSHHHNQLTFGLLYAFSENFILPLSHDEVVHGKGSLLSKMPGDRWQRFANLRALYALMWAHPGKKLLFMGGEIAQEAEWSSERSVDWHLLESQDHAGVRRLVCDLNRLYRVTPALFRIDGEPAGFAWLGADDASSNLLSFVRFDGEGGSLVAACNLSPVPRQAVRVGLPRPGGWREVLNTDAAAYGGSNTGNAGRIEAEDRPWQGQRHSAEIIVPPLAVVWLVPEAGGG
ncbi:MAG TPA: 1,4-alpha-glucan branching protein GlgB [Miltoncostaeaceae bacterium]|nr:1,4-alpha-glucan branching protein GlgB [Miltoncostaeaceae bacterium]